MKMVRGWVIKVSSRVKRAAKVKKRHCIISIHIFETERK